MGILGKLQKVQAELKAPKDKYNKYGDFHYRSCEGILEAVKPVLAKHKAVVTVSDKIVLIGDRYYVEATARFFDMEDEKAAHIENVAYAREAVTKKGMDESQITGTASSYARKYALNGLFLIDDAKDADTEEHHNEVEDGARRQKTQTQRKQAETATPDEVDVDPDLIPHGEGMTDKRIKRLRAEMLRTGITEQTIFATYGVDKLANLSESQYIAAINRFALTASK